MTDNAPQTLPAESSFQVTHIRQPADGSGTQRTSTSDRLTSAEAIAYIAESAATAAAEGLSESPGEAVASPSPGSSSADAVPVSLSTESVSPDAAELGDS